MTREGSAISHRQRCASSFEYDATTGRFVGGHLQRGEGGTLEVNKCHLHDSHGNQTRAVDGSGNDLRTSVYSSFDALRSVSASGSSHTTIWAYGIGRERLVREDDDSAIPSAAAASMTHYIGNAEPTR